jgi:tetratricopeptide (TPR) repeat protein
MDLKQRRDFLKNPRIDLGGRHKKKRIDIAKRWAAVKDQEAVVPLTTVARDPGEDAEVRWEATRALGKIGGAEAVSSLATILADQSNSELHLVAITGLTEIGTGPAVHAIINAWEDQRNAVKKALVDLGQRRTIGPLIEATGHGSAVVRERAIEMLRQYGDVASQLVERLDDEDAGVQETAAEALVRIGEPAVRPLLAAVPTSPSAADVLLRLKDVTTTALRSTTTQDVPLLITALGFEDNELRRIASERLLTIGELAVRPLLAAVPTAPQATDVLLKMKDITGTVLENVPPDDVSLLVTALKFEDKELQQLARERLIDIGEPVVPSLLALLGGEDAAQVQIAEEILSEMGERAVRPLALKLGDAEIGQKAAELMRQVGEPALSALFDALSDPNCTDQEAAIDIICSISDMDRLTLAQTQYRERLPFLLPYAKNKVLGKLMMGDASFKEQMSWETGNEELLAHGLYYHDERYQDVETSLWHDGEEEPNPDQAIPKLQALSAIAPEFALPHYWLGQWYLLKLNDVKKAILSFEQAAQSEEYLDYEHRKAKSYWWLGVSYGTLSPHLNYEESMRCFDQAIELGWDEALLYQGIHLSIDVFITQCLEKGGNPTLFLDAIRRNTEALSAYSEREPEREDIKAFLKQCQNDLDIIEGYYDKLDEAAAFARARAGLILARAKELSRADEDAQAIDLVRNLLREQPDHAEAHQELGRFLIYEGQVHEGIKEFKQYVSCSGEESSTGLFLFQLIHFIEVHVDFIDHTLDDLIARGRYQEALDLLSDWEDMFKPSVLPSEGKEDPWPNLENNVGDMLTRIGYRYSKVAQASGLRRAYEKALSSTENAASLTSSPEAHKNLPLAHRDIAVYFLERDNRNQALRHLQKAVDLNPQFGDGWWLLSIVYAKLNDSQASRNCLMRAADLGDPDALNMLRRLRAQF